MIRQLSQKGNNGLALYTNTIDQEHKRRVSTKNHLITLVQMYI